MKQNITIYHFSECDNNVQRDNDDDEDDNDIHMNVILLQPKRDILLNKIIITIW